MTKRRLISGDKIRWLGQVLEANVCQVRVKVTTCMPHSLRDVLIDAW